MQYLKSFLSLSLLCNIASPVKAFELPKVPRIVKASPAIMLAGSVFLLFKRDPKPDAKPRYDLNKLTDIALAKSNPKAYLENWKLFYLDGFVGQYFKDSHMKMNPDGTIKQSRKAYPFGVLGWSATYLKTQKKTAEMLSALAIALKMSNINSIDGFLVFMGLKKDSSELEELKKYHAKKLRILRQAHDIADESDSDNDNEDN